MTLLVVFAFLAGLVTVLSPCILPVLPIILSSGIGAERRGKARPFGVVLGFVGSFTIFTLFLSSIVRFSGVSADTLRLLSVIVIAGFGLALFLPRFQLLLERLVAKFGTLIPHSGFGGNGFGSGFVIGCSLGLLWTPCVGPILASVITLAISGSVTLDAVVLTFAYSLGAALPMLAIMWGGRELLQRVPWLLSHAGKIQQAFGVLMILTAVAILTNVDRKFQTFIVETFPRYGAGLTRLEENSLVQNALEGIGGPVAGSDTLSARPSKTESRLPQGPKAPELVASGQWFNSDPLRLADLRGKVVVIDFWTYSCINCQRTLPYLKAWHEKYADQGLVIIGVHAPEFEFEKSPDNVRKALADFGIRYPVMQDNDFATWRAYSNHYWPAKYIIDKDGYVRYTHFGEGEYDETERVIQELLGEAGATKVSEETVNNPEYDTYAKTPETYFGYSRSERFDSTPSIRPDVLATYAAPEKLSRNHVGLSGEWVLTREYATPQKDSQLLLDFEAKEVFLVMRPSGNVPARVRVSVDGEVRDFGVDNHEGIVTVDGDRLYKLVHLPKPGRHVLQLEFLDGGVEAYAFTFG